MNYQTWLIEIRPEIIIKNKDSSINEQFQNKTIRPILKLLNNTIIAFSKEFIASQEIKLENKSTIEIDKIIQTLYKKHPTFKVYLVGMVISYLSEQELTIYLQNQKEINKRINILMEERLRSQITLLVS